jgi:hypothetical protein
MKKKIKNLKFIFDFDSTITINDSTTKLPILGSKLKEYKNISIEYQKTYEKLFQENYKDLKKLKTQTKEEKIISIKKFLKNLEFSETFGIDSIEKERILQNIKKEQFQLFGKEIKVHNFSHDFFKYLNSNNFETHILSSGWCSESIHSCVSHNYQNKFFIKSNELEYVNNVSTGIFLSKDVVTFHDKFNYLCQNGIDHFVFAGNDYVDLIPILHSDLGVLLNPSDDLRFIIESIQFDHIKIIDNWKSLQELVVGYVSELK